MRRGLLLGMLVTALLLMPHGSLRASDAKGEYVKANQLFARGKFSAAAARYRALLSSRTSIAASPVLYTKMGDCYFKLGDYARALSSYRAALQGQKNSLRPATQYWIGFCCLMLGNDAEAVDEFLKIPRLYPSAGMWVNTAYYWAGRASERRGDKDRAAGFYRRAGGSGKSVQGGFALRKADAVKNR
jgi:tetratricopeptide (TPR) repeat protein